MDMQSIIAQATSGGAATQSAGSSLMGFLPTNPVYLIIGAIALFFMWPFISKAFKGLFRLVMFIPVMGAVLVSVPLRHVLPLGYIQAWARKRIDKAMSADFDAKEMALSIWPEEKYPELYAEVPDDIHRPVFEDGRTPDGIEPSEFVHNLWSEEVIEKSMIIGGQVAMTFFILSVITILYYAVPDTWNTIVGVQPAGVTETWPSGVTVDDGFDIEIIDSLIAIFSGIVSTAFLSGGAFLLSWGLARTLPPQIARILIDQASQPWRVRTKDSRTRFRYRAASRRILRNVYRKQVDLALNYLKGKPTYKFGNSTGLLRMRGDLSAPVADMPMCMDAESLHANLFVTGGTGEGKTTGVLKPLARQVIKQASPRYAVFSMDAKGVLWRDLKTIAEKEGRGEDVKVVGLEEAQFAVDPLSGLKPADVAYVSKSLLAQASGGNDSGGDFWPQMAATAIGHCAALAKAEGKYNLDYIYKLCKSQQLQQEAIDNVLKLVKNGKAEAPTDVRAAVDYLGKTWVAMAENTKTGIVASITQIFDPLATNGELSEKFGRGRPGLSIESMLEDGQITLFDISTAEHGLAARFVLMLIKSAFYRAARVREMKIGSKKCQENPCLVLVDEAQEIVTADKSGMSDASVWNVSRSSGLAGVFGTQTVAALTFALGEQATNNLIQQFRSKIFLRSEDPETLNLITTLAGEQMRAKAPGEDQHESIELRKLQTGFDVLDWESGRKNAVANSENLNTFSGAIEVAAAYLGNRTAINQYSTQEFSADYISGMGEDHRSENRQADWRVEDKKLQYLNEGNDEEPVLKEADILSGGRWHAYAHLQRAGALRHDIMEVEHDFT